uniref:Ig-like domain-containing protein n=1 Tax=Acanthochromis polyacanthus TaxID=80966 RepID=A0A3Q1FN72_9TELE
DTGLNMFFKIIFLFSGAVCICAESNHELCHVFGCFDSSDTQLCLTLDDDEVYYADFKKGVLIWDGKIPTSFQVSWAYEYALKYRTICRNDMQTWKRDESTTKKKVPPEVIIYPRDDVIKEEDNTLICFINHFFPPIMNVTWTKNDVEVAEETPFVKFLPNPDGTFHFFSLMLVFIICIVTCLSLLLCTFITILFTIYNSEKMHNLHFIFASLFFIWRSVCILCCA